jgi:hypothetical protein
MMLRCLVLEGCLVRVLVQFFLDTSMRNGLKVHECDCLLISF